MSPSQRLDRDITNGPLERHRRHVVALVDDDQAVAGGELGEVVTLCEALDHRHVHDPGRLVATTADLTDVFGVEIEVGDEAVLPLLDKRFAVDDDQGRDAVAGDQGAADHRLA